MSLLEYGVFGHIAKANNLAVIPGDLKDAGDRVKYAKEVLGFAESERRATLLQTMVSSPQQYYAVRNELLRDAHNSAATSFANIYENLTQDREKDVTVGGDTKKIKIPAMPEIAARSLALNAAQAQYQVLAAAVEVADPSEFGNLALQIGAAKNNKDMAFNINSVQKAIDAQKKH